MIMLQSAHAHTCSINGKSCYAAACNRRSKVPSRATYRGGKHQKLCVRPGLHTVWSQRLHLMKGQRESLRWFKCARALMGVRGPTTSRVAMNLCRYLQFFMQHASKHSTPPCQV